MKCSLCLNTNHIAYILKCYECNNCTNVCRICFANNGDSKSFDFDDELTFMNYKCISCKRNLTLENILKTNE